ncbi:hypothetical protein ASPWEDRAFT_118467 [Aspergillus wentii DTO 134E9]|uniref:Zn(2)-C6 fungal-type domain-containing protein n=1 Tax=Aspergillus wentii DTO 134E9 TaxID=1073089 RepID=A0A1L9R7F6_ASPWE|nr:uncharacterized protein ASPWEDRAFT_118467 [Aspergillus wentii DTO 134E9]KAI9927477.1 hypothetical protein MW887_003092 [Aspergillus wentii]OJJ30852.1 hypothetical protein ASPWEDRAFT_118467 [Aspergillus wentii DTO 134E9]
MSQPVSALTSASGPEKHARSRAPKETPTANHTTKPRSCVICRSRKVRCDKLSPCSNCRRANIACVFPAKDRSPRWARRLDRLGNTAVSNPQASQDVMERVRDLENLVKELNGQLEQANRGGHSARSSLTSPGSSTHQEGASSSARHGQNQFGRLVPEDPSRSRYVSSGFWSRVNDELDGLKTDTDGASPEDLDTSDETSLGKTPSTQELNRTPSERHAFLFGHNLSSSTVDLKALRPLPSQISYLLDVFAENVNIITQVVHLPTVKKMVRGMRGRDMSLSPANDALLFSIYYAAITSMEEDDVIADFGSAKTELNLRYRLGLEHALARADFLAKPDLVLVQAFSIFLLLARRHDSPQFVWMMTGLAIRMGQSIGLHHDSAHFDHLTPYEIEMRRRVWWVLCMLDGRASEDQGTECTIPLGSFDTKIPLNINDGDIGSDSKEMPREREGLTDMSFARVSIAMCDAARQMTTAHSFQVKTPSPEDQSRLLVEIDQRLQQSFLQYSNDPENITYWVLATVSQLVMSKMNLLIYLPVLFSSPSEHFSADLRTKLLVSAIEVAEYNHALNAEESCRQWRWLFQTYTHWHAVVYILIEISRRPWSPIVERAWIALHSIWLIPNRFLHTNKNPQIWFPLRRLMAKAKKHRRTELERLSSDMEIAEQLRIEDEKIPLPSSSGLFPEGPDTAGIYLRRWSHLVTISNAPDVTNPPGPSTYATQPSKSSILEHNEGAARPPSDGNSSSTDLGQALEPDNSPFFPTFQGNATSIDHLLCAEAYPALDPFGNVTATPSDINMDLDGNVNWYDWVESARGVELAPNSE